MARRRVRPKKKTPPTQAATERPPRMKITPEESLRYMQAFAAERMPEFIDSVRSSEKAGG